jgi:Aspartic acid proteinase inhibitor
MKITKLIIRNWMKAVCIVLIFCASCFLTGCSTTSQSLLEHPKAVVRYPAKAGEVVGEVVGVPVAIVCLPISLIVGSMGTDEERNWAPLYPLSLTANIMTTLVGGPSWLLFGWWGDMEPCPVTPPCGGWFEASTTNERVLAAARYAVDAERQVLTSNRVDVSSASLSLVQVVSARLQVVGGMNYDLCLMVQGAGGVTNAEAVVWRRFDGTQLLTSWKWKSGGYKAR